ncbi:MAG: DUF938 domain-containing protein [Alphaproteobacteria bacterium]
MTPRPPLNPRPETGAPSSPSVARNRGPILAVLRDRLPKGARILEIASGSGEHALYLAPRLAAARWQTSDLDPAAMARIAARISGTGQTALAPPIRLDVADPDWPGTARAALADPDAILAINLVHIAPWRVCAGLMAGAGALLAPGKRLYLYGAYKRDGRHTAPSNARFDAGLRARNPEWGVRDLETVVAEAAGHGLDLADIIKMPADNLSLVFHRGVLQRGVFQRGSGR